MIDLLASIGIRLNSNAYVNEASITHGIVMPILAELGWDTADPTQVIPEFANERGRVDFALMGLGRKPAIFVEVKQPGRAHDGDRQLFEYSFHEGVPLCVLTDGREWSFYLPSGQGSYDDRRVYRLQLNDRKPQESQRTLERYLKRKSVLDQSAFEHARRDHQNIAGRREALLQIPSAWGELVDEEHELLIEVMIDKVEALSGYAPDISDIASFLKSLTSATDAATLPKRPATKNAQQRGGASKAGKSVEASQSNAKKATEGPRSVGWTLFGKRDQAANASIALARILRAITKRDPSKVAELAKSLETPKRHHIARSHEEIYPGRPDLARAAEIGGGWLVGLNIANRTKMAVIREACDVYGLSIPDDLEITLPNA